MVKFYSLGIFIKSKFKNFFDNIDDLLQNAGQSRIRWDQYINNAKLIGPKGIIARYKSGKLATSEFVNLMLDALKIYLYVSPEQFINAWNSIVDLKNDDIPKLLNELQKPQPGLILISDTNPLHQSHIKKLLGRHYQSKPYQGSDFSAMIFNIPVIFSYHLGVSSAVIITRGNLFECTARRIVAARPALLTPNCRLWRSYTAVEHKELKDKIERIDGLTLTSRNAL